NPLILLKPLKNDSTNSLIKLSEYILSIWREKAGNEKVLPIDLNDFIDLNMNMENAELLSPSLYVIPLEWLTYYYAIYNRIDPGISKLVRKVRATEI
ncbi:MAG: hypothetical protein ACTSQY_07325, partial [Candidatus Odinarchaeia archaeon]